MPAYYDHMLSVEECVKQRRHSDNNGKKKNEGDALPSAAEVLAGRSSSRSQVEIHREQNKRLLQEIWSVSAGKDEVHESSGVGGMDFSNKGRLRVDVRRQPMERCRNV
jgi:hypothetical protein